MVRSVVSLLFIVFVAYLLFEMATTIEERLAQVKARNTWSPSEVLPRLYLGNGNDAKNKEKLKEEGFTHIINVANDVENFFPNEFHYLNLDVGDFGTDKGISRVFKKTFNYLEENWKHDDSSKILLHCAAGMNRSATLYIAVVMYFKKMNLKDAYELVRSKRKIIPIKDNREELVQYELEMFGSNSMSVDDFTNRLKRDHHLLQNNLVEGTSK